MYCTKCGNKLKDNDKFCTRCGTKQFVSSIQIIGSTRDYEHNSDEEETANIIIDDLGIDKSLFEYKKSCEDYSTIAYKNFDLFRLKYTNNTRWIKVYINPSYKKEFIDNEIFSAQTNKNQIYWKSNIKSIFDYKEILLKGIKEIDKF